MEAMSWSHGCEGMTMYRMCGLFVDRGLPVGHRYLGYVGNL